ncbi:MAG: DUF1329 domain-containing protein [Deltaproteobacteria bacterium]|nr:DUF1329 domain-containing protein [Deltaproteobacteria bacterium]
MSILILLITLSPVSVHASAEVADSAPFKEGEVMGFDRVAELRPFLPEELWPHRQFYFYEGMKLEIGPFKRVYPVAEAYLAKSEEFRGVPEIGPGGSLVGYKAGRAFPTEEIDCAKDPNAGVKIMWNFATRWHGDGAAVSFYYSYWDRGERIPLFFEGTARGIVLAGRVEKQFWDNGNEGDLIRKNDKRVFAHGVDVESPPEYRGTTLLSFVYKDAMGPAFEAAGIDTWVYVPILRRVRRFSGAQRTEAIAGTDFAVEDSNSFAGVIPEFEWECLGEQDLLAPVNTKVQGYPYEKDHDFGPYGLSFANDRWELRNTVKVRFIPKDPDHPYRSKIIYLDKETGKTLYSFAYDRKGDLWKIIMHNGRWSEDAPDQFKGWPDVPRPKTLVSVGDIITNVQTGTGNRIEFWDIHTTPFLNKKGSIDKGKVRRYIATGRLTTTGH